MRELFREVRSVAVIPGVPSLLIGTFAISLGSFLVIPFFVIYLRGDLGMSSWAVGVALTIKLWSQNGLMLLGGPLADRFGSVATMCLGLVLRGAAYVGLALATGQSAVWLAAFALGLGSALYMPAGKAALATLADPVGRHADVFGIRAAVNNSGAALGPALGALLLLFSPRMGLIAAAALYLVVLWPVWRARHHIGRAQQRMTADAPHRSAPLPLAETSWLMAGSAAFGAGYAQLELSIPVTIQERHGAGLLGFAFTLNAAAIVVLQLPVLRAVRRLEPASAVALGLVSMAAAFLGFGMPGVGWVVVAILLFTIAEALLDPTLDAAVGRRVPVASRGRVFGLLGISFAAGGGIATLATSIATDLSGLGMTFWAWLALALFGCSIALRLLAPREKIRTVTSARQNADEPSTRPNP